MKIKKGVFLTDRMPPTTSLQNLYEEILEEQWDETKAINIKEQHKQI